MNSKDIIFLTLPRVELRTPLTALAILKAHVEKHGFTAHCMDLNIELWHKVPTDAKEAWMESSTTMVYQEPLEIFWNDYVQQHIPEWIETIKKHNPRWLGINIFYLKNQSITKKFCAEFKKHLPDVKIVLGGSGIIKGGEDFIKEGLADCYVRSEGEHPILEILNGNLDAPGVNLNPPKQIDDLEYVPIPDYSDYNLNLYSRRWWDTTDDSELGTDSLYISGSRGCIRKCTFCDIQNIWPKFRYRDGVDIAEEMKVQATKHNIKLFQFTDSLINGSVKQLINLCDTLNDYYAQNKMPKIKWEGQFCIRSEKQMPESVWKSMKDAGCKKLFIGIESGSENVRKHMQKMYNEQDLEFNFEMCEKYGIQMTWLILIGYPTETEEDFQDTLNLLKKYKYLNDKGLVAKLQLGPTLEIGHGSPLHARKEELGIWFEDDPAGNQQWRTETNTRETRLQRWIKAMELATELGYDANQRNTKHFKNELKNIYGTGIDSMGPTM